MHTVHGYPCAVAVAGAPGIVGVPPRDTGVRARNRRAPLGSRAWTGDDVMRWWLAVTFGWMALGGLIGTVLVGDEGLDANLAIPLFVLILVGFCVAVIAA